MMSLGNGGMVSQILTSEVNGGEWSASRLGRFTLVERQGLCGSRGLSGFWRGEKSLLPCRESNHDFSAVSLCRVIKTQ